MFLCAPAEGAAPDVVPQLLYQLGALLLDLLGELLSSKRTTNTHRTTQQNMEPAAGKKLKGVGLWQ